MTTKPAMLSSHRYQPIVEREWRRRLEAEYLSALLTQRLTTWLIQVAAPLELVRAGLAIVLDELAHCEASRDVVIAAGGNDTVDFGTALDNPQPLREQLLSALTDTCIESFCVGETVAVRLFLRLRARCTQPTARAALDRIVKDEVRHRDFGWTLLEWLLSTPRGDEVRSRIARTLPTVLRRLRTNYASAKPDASSEFDPELYAWGLMPSSHYAEVLEQTLERDFVPLFSAHGVDARSAWLTRPATHLE